MPVKNSADLALFNLLNHAEVCTIAWPISWISGSGGKERKSCPWELRVVILLLHIPYTFNSAIENKALAGDIIFEQKPFPGLQIMNIVWLSAHRQISVMLFSG